MNIQQFRSDLKEALDREQKSANSLARETGIQQASLSRFLSEKTSLDGDAVLRLWDFVYGDSPVSATPTTPSTTQQQDHSS